jgi:Zn-finger protein
MMPNFIKTDLGIQKLTGGYFHRHTHRQECDLTCPLLFFRNKENRLKMRHSDTSGIHSARDQCFYHETLTWTKLGAESEKNFFFLNF